MKWAVAVVMLLGTMWAQDAKTCPAEVVRVLPNYVEFGAGCRFQRECDAVEIRNTSTKKIVGAKFHMVYLDAVGDANSNGMEYTGDSKVKPGKKSTYVWRTKFLVDDQSQGASAWIEKLLFEDGTTWTDDGSRKCRSIGK